MTTPAASTTPTPRTRRLRIAAVVTATLAALAAALYVIDTRTDAISYALNVPAMRDWSTPANQGGFELVNVQRGDAGLFGVGTASRSRTGGPPMNYPGDTRLIIRCAWPNAGMLMNGLWKGQGIRASFRLSTGSVGHLPLGKCRQLDTNNEQKVGDSQQLEMFIPGHYPSDCRWIDATITSDDGHMATWRIVRLPRTYRVIAANDLFATTFTTPSGVVFKGVPRSGSKDHIDYLFSVSRSLVRLPPGESWQYTPARELSQIDWETKDIASRRDHYNPTLEDPGATWVYTKAQPGGMGDSAYSPYPANRFCRFYGDVAHVATLDEHVTFRDVPIGKIPDRLGVAKSDNAALTVRPPKPLTAISPSGVVIRVLPPERYGSNLDRDLVIGVETSVPVGFYKYYIDAPFVNVPGSPLVKKYRKPIQLGLEFIDSTWSAWSISSGRKTFQVSTKPSNAPTIPSFTVVIHQRAILERYPVSYTYDCTKVPLDIPKLPIAAPAPPKATRTP
ncbi:MAG TPA: hypothetical protein VGK19_22790 [Capsulimonadaceae bacterium]|jgi:hypothetical protein